MNLYPKWLLGLAGINLLSILLSVFFLFGGVHPFGSSSDTAVNFLYYVATQLIWLLPIGAFFGALHAHDHERPVVAAFIAIAGIATMIGGLYLLI
ncbi:MAG: hypothetical protein IJ786_02980 [Bacteroidaceae bacterium]|nr:hypothetical protein [Bacteroidaceae bacterium]